jgi:hypothetical protein
MTPLIFLIIGFIVILAVVRTFWRRQQQQIARAYESAKQALIQNPHDSALKGRCIIYGRLYYKSLKGLKLSSDIEQAISRDLMPIVDGSHQS